MTVVEKDLDIFLLPGLDGTGKLFNAFADAAPLRFNPIIYSYSAEVPQSYDQLADKVFGQLPAEREYLLLGESFSAPVALKVAARRPSGLLGVVLAAGFMFPPFPSWMRRLPWGIAAHLPLRRLVARRLLANGVREKDVLRDIRAVLRSVPPAALSARVRTLLATDCREEIFAFDVPILYIGGSRDRLVQERCRAEILACRGNARAAVLDAPHLVLQTAPHTAWQHIEQFVRTVVPISS